MASSPEKSYAIKVIVLSSLWLVVASFLYLGGLSVFIASFQGGGDPGEAYMMWGGLCALATLASTIRRIFRTSATGYQNGKYDVTVSWTGSSWYVSHHGWLYALLGFIVSLIISVVIGPIYCGYHIVINIIKIVRAAKDLHAMKEAERPYREAPARTEARLPRSSSPSEHRHSSSSSKNDYNVYKDNDYYK